MNTIKLTRNQVLWNATFSDPEILRLFGTDTLPTAFKATTPADKVLKEIQSSNPDCRVSVG